MSKELGADAASKRAYRHSGSKFHRTLHDRLARVGIEVEFDKEVVDYFEKESERRAGVVLKNGSRHKADLVVAAGGVKGTS